MGKTSLEAVAVRGMRREVQFGFAEIRGTVKRVKRRRMIVVSGFQMKDIL